MAGAPPIRLTIQAVSVNVLYEPNKRSISEPTGNHLPNWMRSTRIVEDALNEYQCAEKFRVLHRLWQPSP